MSQDRHQTQLPQPVPRGFQNQSVLRYTLSASGLSLESSKVAVAQRLSLIRSPDAPSLCEKSGLEDRRRKEAEEKRARKFAVLGVWAYTDDLAKLTYAYRALEARG